MQISRLDMTTDPARTEHLLRNLLLVIHEDEGHHTTEFGLEQSCQNAISRILLDRQRMDDCYYTLKSLVGRLLGL